MHAHMINVEHAYPENIPLIDEAFDGFDWDSYPRESLSASEIDSFYQQASQMKTSAIRQQNLSNPYAHH